MTQIDGKLWIIAQLSLKTVGLMMVSPVFWLTLWFTYRYYLKYEWEKAGARRLALASSLEGIGAGFFVIWLTALLGLVIRPSLALYIMGPASMILSILRPRFLCLSYGAGVVIVLCTLAKVPADILGITGLVAILHLAEGLLVLFFGGNHTVTIYHQKRRQILPGSGIYRFWPVPVCLLIMVQEGGEHILNMPGWWPMISTASFSIFEVCGLLPLAVSLGYSDLSGKLPEIKRRRVINGIMIIFYAIVLLWICLSAHGTVKGQWTAVIWMVLGHEAIILSPNLFTKK